jgi:hypothetical protein
VAPERRRRRNERKKKRKKKHWSLLSFDFKRDPKREEEKRTFEDSHTVNEVRQHNKTRKTRTLCYYFHKQREKEIEEEEEEEEIKQQRSSSR